MNEPAGTVPIDLMRLGAWMDDQSLPAGPITDVETLGGGTQNTLLRFSRGGEHYVLRRPPVHKRANSDETMRREARVLAALAGSDVPHPRLIAACGDLDVLGAAFYLMEPVEGANPTVALPPRYLADPGWRHELGLAMADGAAAIAAFDYVAAGLADLGRPKGFLERQVGRWRSQLCSYMDIEGYAGPGPDLGDVEEIGSWLDTHRPTSWQPGLIHGDYHLANVLCRPDRPALAAVVDWELTTIGDPLLDLGWLLATWPNEGETYHGPVHVHPGDGFPTGEELVERYRQRSAHDLSSITWYEVLACYKLGIILEGTHARACGGLAPKDIGDALHVSAVWLLARAQARMCRA